MKKIKLILAIFLAAALIFGCTDNNEPDTRDISPQTEADGSSGGNEDNNTDSEGSGSVEARPEYDLPVEDFGGYNFRIISRSVETGGWGNPEIAAEEETGDPINDAVYNRNRAIEEAYNMRIINIASMDVETQAGNSIRAASDDFDIIVVGLNRQLSLKTSGGLYNLYNVPHVNLSGAWWDQRAVEQLSVINKLYVTTGDLTIRDKDSAAIFLFSKQLISDLGLADPYGLVASDTWTFDVMYDMMRAATRDLNGDGIIDDEDQIGLITANEYARYLFNASGEFMSTLGADSVPQITIYNERAVAVTEKIKEIQGAREYALNAQDFSNKYADIWGDFQTPMFAGNRALFFHCRMAHITALRDMDSDFGILPPPKFDSSQESYHAVVGTWTASGVSVPHTVADPEKTGLILEALVHEGRYTLLPAYYDINLKTKMARDEESVAMIDIILESRLYDLGELYGWGDMAAFLEGLSQGTGTLTTFWERNAERAERAMQATLDRLESLD